MSAKPAPNKQPNIKRLVDNRADEMMSQLKQSWPQTMEKILASEWGKRDSFFVYTTTKWDYSGDKPKYLVYHQPRLTMPDPFYGTTLRRINNRYGAVEVIWALPHQGGLENYAPGKMFYNEFVWESIHKKQMGVLDRMVDEYNKGLKKSAA